RGRAQAGNRGRHHRGGQVPELRHATALQRQPERREHLRDAGLLRDDEVEREASASVRCSSSASRFLSAVSSRMRRGPWAEYDSTHSNGFVTTTRVPERASCAYWTGAISSAVPGTCRGGFRSRASPNGALPASPSYSGTSSFHTRSAPRTHTVSPPRTKAPRTACGRSSGIKVARWSRAARRRAWSD